MASTWCPDFASRPATRPPTPPIPSTACFIGPIFRWPALDPLPPSHEWPSYRETEYFSPFLGGTELPLILQDGMVKNIPFLDTMAIHVKAACVLMLGREQPVRLTTRF